ncbi:MAG: HD domain-containing phosphohydrolase [Motiliproteus sp.]
MMAEPHNTIGLPPEQLIVGMYVTLPREWLSHEFLFNQFLIKSDKQLTKLRQSGLKQIQIDLSKSQLPADWSAPTANNADITQTPASITAERDITDHFHPLDPKESGDLPDWNPDTLIPEGLKEALSDKKLAPQQRSQAVYQHSRELMTRLLATPTAENLKASKQAIGMITDLILSDDQTASNMLRITSHDFYTYTHSVNVGVTSIMLAKALFGQSDAHDMHELGAGFFLHDLGKVRIRAEVINKPGRLTDDEMRHMRTHPFKGYKLLERSNQLSEESRIIILQHHERDDGQGYPKQLAGEQIHIYGKVCCIADVYDALTAERSYKKAMSNFDALMLMKNQMSDHFDKKLFSEFVNLMR